MTAADPTLGGLLGPAPKQQDPPGTCHQVGCPGKGVHPPHGIGVPSEETWRATSQPIPGPQRFTISRTMAERLHAFCEALGRDPGIARVHAVEARILADQLRGLL